jgi:hypothetical protein
MPSTNRWNPGTSVNDTERPSASSSTTWTNVTPSSSRKQA